MTILLLAQSIVPLLILAWLAASPAASALGLAVQVLGSLLAVAAISSTGLWLFPPWWFPRAVLITLAVVGAWRLYRSRQLAPLPGRVSGWIGVAFFAGLAAAGTYTLARARVASGLPDPSVAVDLDFPLEDGRYLVVNGGAWVTLNAHRASMDTAIARLRPWRGNGHAVDIVALDGWGMRARGMLPVDPKAYSIYGRRVLAPCSGSVFSAVDGVPDMPVPEQDRVHMAGNHVILDCDGVHVVLAHFQPGSLLVHHGSKVEAGHPIARVGNSGMTSEPHLHIHAQRPGPVDAPMGGDPLPMRLGGRYLVRGDRVGVGAGEP
jgi:hypothetical protein